MSMDMTIIRMVINTLNTIEVKGKENMSALLGSIEALEAFEQMEAAKQEQKREVADGGQGDN